MLENTGSPFGSNQNFRLDVFKRNIVLINVPLKKLIIILQFKRSKTKNIYGKAYLISELGRTC